MAERVPEVGTLHPQSHAGFVALRRSSRPISLGDVADR